MPAATTMKPALSKKKQNAFIITIDTEGDNLWSRPKEITVENAKFLPRFQELCEKYSFKPTYLTNYEMATDNFFVEFAGDALKRNTAEVGMHLHAWNSPPIVPITEDDFHWQPFLVEYSEEVMLKKIEFMTKLLEDTFQTKMTSHRAGRWAFNESYARILVDLGYRIDCSVTPGVSWYEVGDGPAGFKGTDYTSFPEHPYYMNLDSISESGDSSLLEVPVSIDTWRPFWAKAASRIPILKRVARRLAPEKQWMRPRQRPSTSKALQAMAARYVKSESGYLQFMLHSSEFMPGGSPNFSSNESIEGLYRMLEELFDFCTHRYEGLTLTEYADQYSN